MDNKTFKIRSSLDDQQLTPVNDFLDKIKGVGVGKGGTLKNIETFLEYSTTEDGLFDKNAFKRLFSNDGLGESLIIYDQENYKKLVAIILQTPECSNNGDLK